MFLRLVDQSGSVMLVNADDISRFYACPRDGKTGTMIVFRASHGEDRYWYDTTFERLALCLDCRNPAIPYPWEDK